MRMKVNMKKKTSNELINEHTNREQKIENIVKKTQENYFFST
jgi:hypothetical protein